MAKVRAAGTAVNAISRATDDRPVKRATTTPMMYAATRAPALVHDESVDRESTGRLNDRSHAAAVELAMPSSLNFGRTFSQGGALAWVPTHDERGSRAHRGRSIIATSEPDIIISSRSSLDARPDRGRRPAEQPGVDPQEATGEQRVERVVLEPLRGVAVEPRIEPTKR